MLFLDTPGRTGKTYVRKAVQQYLKALRKELRVVTSSAIAAVLLRCGRKAHSASKITVLYGEENTCYISVNSDGAQKL